MFWMLVRFSFSPSPCLFSFALTFTPSPFLQTAHKPLNVAMTYHHPFDRLAVASKPAQGPISLKRTLTEKDQLSGRLDVEVVNRDLR
jgi:hypothetical protein